MDDGHRYRDQSSQPVRALLGRRRLAESRESTRRRSKRSARRAPRRAPARPPNAPTTRRSVGKATRQEGIPMSVPRPHDRPISTARGG